VFGLPAGWWAAGRCAGWPPREAKEGAHVDALHAAGNLGAGQTIVLLDAYGSPTARQDLQKFHDTFFPTLPNPNFDAVYPFGAPDFKNGCQGNGTGHSGPCAAAGWSGEATLDIEWAYAIAPKAHIVLIGVPPAETLGVQGFPNLFKALQQAIDRYPPGTVFSQSFAATEQSFGGAAKTQTARFDAVYRAAAAKGDTVLIALANEQQAKAGQPPLGFLNPLLYKVGDQAGAATAAFNGGGAFRDVVPHTYGTAASGVLADNRLWQYNPDGSVAPGPVAGWPTLAGWDMTTGFGSPRAAAFVAAIRAARNSP
jgi:subtilase family serine protease